MAAKKPASRRIVDPTTGNLTLEWANYLGDLQKSIADLSSAVLSGGVASFEGRGGVVVSAAGDYDASEVDNDSGVTGATVADALDTLDGDIATLSGTIGGFADATRTLTAGAGLTGGGDLTADRSFAVGAGTGIAVNADDVALSHLGFEALTDPGADRIQFWDESANALAWLELGTNLSISGTTLNAAAGSSGGITVGTVQASTSGTAIDFTGLPAALNRITVIFDSVSLSGTDEILVQIGDSGGIETTGYASGASVNVGSAVSQLADTAGFNIMPNNAARGMSGLMVIARITGNVWVASHAGGFDTPVALVGGGRKELSDELTQIRITRAGTNTFDGGQINIFYE